MKVKIVAEKIQIHCPLRVKTKTNQNENILGIDKGYKYLFATSSEKLYGENLNQYLSKETERLTKVNSNRNRLYAKYLMHLENGNYEKAKLIKENNLGKKKYSKAKHRHDENVKSYINCCLNNLLEQEKPKEIVMEQLDFVSWDDRFQNQ